MQRDSSVGAGRSVTFLLGQFVSRLTCLINWSMIRHCFSSCHRYCLQSFCCVPYLIVVVPSVRLVNPRFHRLLSVHTEHNVYSILQTSFNIVLKLAISSLLVFREDLT